MDRRNFLKLGGLSILAAYMMPNVLFGEEAAKQVKSKRATYKGPYLGPKRRDKWLFLGNGSSPTPQRYHEIHADVAVVGGGIAGICAAVSAARHGSKVILIQDRPMLGGNASSEMHVPINGAYHLKNKFATDRETGIVEELQLDNSYYNPYAYWEVWDNILFSYVSEYKNIKVYLNMQAVSTDLEYDHKAGLNKITAAYCWQSTTESVFKVIAKIFIDSSGDGMMAASAGAEYRTGREAKSEFNESYAPEKADGWTMGDSIQFQAIDLGHPVKYTPPSFALKYDFKHAKNRKINKYDCGFWWVELSDEFDNIAKREENRDKLAAYIFGIWDQVKNSGDYPETENYVLSWVGSIAGRRESRRFMGDYILNQNDLLSYRHFSDAVAFGGWSLDEHCPGAMENVKDAASFFHEKFKKIYEIPYRSLYSRNIANLLLAGRDISVTHIALSSTRVMGTCALTGQASGTAAALCIKYNCTPRDISKNKISELQEILLRDDAYIPNRPAKDDADLARKAHLIASDTYEGDVQRLIDGYSRDEISQNHHWSSKANSPEIILSWRSKQLISKVEVKCDSNLHQIICMHPSHSTQITRPFGLPKELLKSAEIQAYVNGRWTTVANIKDNKRRCIKTSFNAVKTSKIKFIFKETHGATLKTLFEIRCYS